MKRDKIILIFLSVIILVVFISLSMAAFIYIRTGEVNSKLVVGEMFTAQINSNRTAYYLITPGTSDYVVKILSKGSLSFTHRTLNTVTIRPTIYLNSNVKIINGTDLESSHSQISM